MTYLIMEMGFLLFCSLLLGLASGWVLKSVNSIRREKELVSGYEKRLKKQSSEEAKRADAARHQTTERMQEFSEKAKKQFQDYEQRLEKFAREREVLIERVAFLESEADGKLGASSPVGAISYGVEEVEGIGEAYGTRLRNAGIKTTEDLAIAYYERDRLYALASKIDVEISELEHWGRMADLMQIPGIRGQFARLLEAVGVSSVRDLAGRSPDLLAHKMSEENVRTELCKTVPSPITVATWVRDARKRDKTLANL